MAGPTGTIITTTTTIMVTAITIMTEARYRLMTWLSPAYPVGAFSYSHGLEYAVEAGLAADCASLSDWIEDCLRHGAGRSDAIIVAHAWRAEDAGARAELAELALALQPARERLLETEAQGAAFQLVTSAVWPAEPIDAAPLPYPVAVGVAARAHAIPLDETLQAYLWAFAANLVSAGVRLVPLGQTDGQRAQATLMPAILDVAREAETADLDDIGGCAFRAEIAAMRHETQHVRLFRS
ncbi:urease accessory protein UreF [Sphingomonas sp. LB-2]|uniref:urease accessory protein UreF n=1 Tax=Sphingomonas caeni TaxID=2984949 RepID=UPI00222E1170|nr:urease accessory protein UreF [Sphingomonas caeni]MCW3848053.1 urease accessory protein UreF [Sphingomonas caeni]